MIEFFVGPIHPRPKNSGKVNRRTGRVFDSPTARRCRKELTRLVRRFAPREPLSGYLRLEATFRLPLAKSWSKTKKLKAQLGEIRPANRNTGDVDNLRKLLQDVLQKAGFFEDDSQIVESESSKVYAEVPGYWVRITGVA